MSDVNIPTQRKTMLLFAASSTWMRITSIASGAYGLYLALAPALGVTAEVDRDLLDATLESAEAAAVATDKFIQAIIAFGISAKLWGDADSKRETGSADLVVGRAVVSPAGNP